LSILERDIGQVLVSLLAFLLKQGPELRGVTPAYLQREKRADCGSKTQCLLPLHPRCNTGAVSETFLKSGIGSYSPRVPNPATRQARASAFSVNSQTLFTTGPDMKHEQSAFIPTAERKNLFFVPRE
jgi:hypothetical protein